MVTTRSTLILNPEDDGSTESPAFGPWPQIGDRAGQDGNPHVAGAVSIDRRVQALLPTACDWLGHRRANARHRVFASLSV